MLVGAELKFTKASFGWPPMWCAHALPDATSNREKRILPFRHFKGFKGGVPINTETAAVKPRVGIAR
jgi:hypothetical protein